MFARAKKWGERGKTVQRHVITSGRVSKSRRNEFAVGEGITDDIAGVCRRFDAASNVYIEEVKPASLVGSTFFLVIVERVSDWNTLRGRWKEADTESWERGCLVSYQGKHHP